MFASSFVVGLAGSRSLCPSWLPLVGGVVASLARGGASLLVGCAVGADALALGSALSVGAPVRVLAAFGPGGAGACPVSAVGPVLAAARGGVPVSWWAGGGPSVPLAARLARRSSALVAAVAAAPRSGLVVFLGPGPSVGSVRAARLAVAAGVPVVVFLCGASSLPTLGAGAWVCAGAGVWATGWRFAPAGG